MWSNPIGSLDWLQLKVCREDQSTMAKLIRNGDFMTEGERIAADKLATDLPADWTVVTNKTLVSRNGVAREIDFIVVASNTIFVIDEKGFRGRIHGNEQYWVFDSKESCESPLNKIDVGARMLAGFIRDTVSEIRLQLGTRPFVTSVVLLSDPSCELFVQEPRRDRILLLDDVSSGLRSLDRSNSGSNLRQFRNEIVEKLRLVPPRPVLPRNINLFTIIEELPAGPYYRCFKANHSAMSQSEYFRVKLYELGMGSAAVTEQQRDLFIRDYRSYVRLADSGIASQVQIPMEWGDGKYIVVGQGIPALPTIRAAVMGKESISFTSIVKISKKLLLSLAKMHELGVVHRNLSPDNIYVNPSTEYEVQFTDFDFSRIDDERSVADIGDGNITNSRYMAPELQSGLSFATEKSDIYSVGAILDELLTPHISDGTKCEWQDVRDCIDSMIAVNPNSRWSSANEAFEVLSQLLDVSSAVAVPLTNSFSEKPVLNSTKDGASKILAGRYRVIRTLGEGATAETYLVEDTEYDGHYVLKRIKDISLAKQLASAEFKALRHLPEHPTIVKVIDAFPADYDFHLKMEYVDGQSLHELHGVNLWDTRSVRTLVEQLLHGLVFLEKHHIAHRDISPRNVILTDTGPKIIDFGFAATIDEVGMSNVGTVSFRAPELDIGQSWNRTCDRYSVGALGLWLLMGKLPFLRDLNGTILKSELSIQYDNNQAKSALIKTLLKAISNNASERFESALEFIEALQTSDAGTPETTAGLRSVNLWIPQVQSLYRNSRVGNADNRGLDSQFARTTYVPTLLDTELLPQVLDGKFCVVLLSGNPGDGKTAFLEMLFDALSSKPNYKEIYRDKNGWEVDIAGHRFKANYDASESHNGQRSNELLAELFKSFKGNEAPPPDIRETVLVAINDGKMHEFLIGKRDYLWLGREVSWFTDEVAGLDKPGRVVVVDLKQRSVVGDNYSADLLDGVLDKLVSKDNWEICSNCRAREICPMKFNRDSLASNTSGIRNRLRRLIQVSHLRRDRHMTIRDMRSLLSYILVGENSCEDIHNELDEDSISPKWTDRLYYSATFNPDGVVEDNLTEFSICDPASTNHPRLDRILWHLHRTQRTDVTDSWSITIHDRSNEPNRALNRLATPLQWMNLVKRRLYFESNESLLLDDSVSLSYPIDLIPYRFLDKFVDAVIGRSSLDDLLSDVCEGISRANGIADDSVKGRYLCVRTSHSSEHELTVFKRFPVGEFQLTVRQHKGEFVETLPNSLFLLHIPSNSRLAINLDLFEILMRVNSGYLPGSDEQRPFLNDLEQFELRLLNEPADELLLLEAGKRLHRVRQESGTIKYLGVVGEETR